MTARDTGMKAGRSAWPIAGGTRALVASAILAGAILTGCAGPGSADEDLRTAKHTVEEYRKVPELREATLNACRSTSAPSMADLHQQYPACERAFEAHKLLMDEAMSDAIRTSNQRELERRGAAKKPTE